MITDLAEFEIKFVKKHRKQKNLMRVLGGLLVVVTLKQRNIA